jgi:hypothetical protein
MDCCHGVVIGICKKESRAQMGATIATIIAIILGPILAVQIQKWLEEWREGKRRKEYIFKTLMATRGTALSPVHVEALNMIDLEFREKNESDRKVREAWKALLDHFRNHPPDAGDDPDYQSKLNNWGSKLLDFKVDLLYEMSLSLGYGFDKVDLKNNVYAPQAHADLEMEQQIIRRGFVEIMLGQKALPIYNADPEKLKPKQEQNEIKK